MLSVLGAILAVASNTNQKRLVIPSRDEIVDQITKAADIFEMIGIEFLGKKALKDYADKMRMLAAQVSAMRCESCRWWIADIRWNPDKLRECVSMSGKMTPPDFGCFSHEQKPA